MNVLGEPLAPPWGLSTVVGAASQQLRVLRAVERPSSVSQPSSRTRIMYSSRSDMADDQPDHPRAAFPQVIRAAEFWNPTPHQFKIIRP